MDGNDLGVVRGQNPAAGTVVAQGSSVTLTVGATPKQVDPKSTQVCPCPDRYAAGSRREPAAYRDTPTVRIPRAVAVVTEESRVLLIKRYLRRESSAACVMCEGSGPECPGHHYAVLPGGHVEDGETAEEAAMRELAEETGLTAREDHLALLRAQESRSSLGVGCR